MRLKYIKKDLALKYLDQDLKLYKSILESFKEHYESLNLLKLDNNNFFKEIHHLKGFSKNIGANELYILAEEMNKNKNRNFQVKLQEQLCSVLNEISHVFINESKTSNFSVEESKDELYEQILQGAIKNRPKKVEDPLEKLKHHNHLNSKDIDTIKKLDKEIKVYNFKNIINILS